MNRHTAGHSLIGMLVAIAVLMFVMLVYINGGFGSLTGQSEGSPRPDGKGETIVGRSLYRAKDGVCMSNIRQMRTSIQIVTDPVDGKRPQTLQETRLGDSFYKCPVGNEDYLYDPITGKVSCPHPGHENY